MTDALHDDEEPLFLRQDACCQRAVRKEAAL